MGIKQILVVVMMLITAGCVTRGIIYSDTIAPYTWNFKNTPVGTKKCVALSHRIKEPVSGYSLSAEWNSRVLYEEAQKAGISNIYYMDKRTISVLFGIYRRESFILYGD